MTVVFPVVPVSLLGLCPIGNLSDRDFFAVLAINQSVIKRLRREYSLSYLVSPFVHAK
ncbi:hypothetical protein AHGSH82_010190 [Aeromonas hydrophila]|nr:hypothetical protein AHGSH82_010190 [Aeromonas hydrophila]BBT05585.1 hypothetical protein WP7S18E06_10840 [Aeromonas hydrophila]BBT61213.1 hypothetical protein WP8S18E02_10100 [Aeromonas hydrophila]